MHIYSKYKDLKRDSKAATGLALLLHDIECWCMQLAREELAEFGCSALIQDGLMTQQLVPPDAAERCSAAIARATGFQLVFVHKPIAAPKWAGGELKLYEKGSREVVKRIFSSYEQVKAEFEKTHFKLENPLVTHKCASTVGAVVVV
jgi:hypothetical protein